MATTLFTSEWFLPPEHFEDFRVWFGIQMAHHYPNGWAAHVQQSLMTGRKFGLKVRDHDMIIRSSPEVDDLIDNKLCGKRSRAVKTRQELFEEYIDTWGTPCQRWWFSDDSDAVIFKMVMADFTQVIAVQE